MNRFLLCMLLKWFIYESSFCSLVNNLEEKVNPSEIFHLYDINRSNIYLWASFSNVSAEFAQHFLCAFDDPLLSFILPFFIKDHFESVSFRFATCVFSALKSVFIKLGHMSVHFGWRKRQFCIDIELWHFYKHVF